MSVIALRSIPACVNDNKTGMKRSGVTVWIVILGPFVIMSVKSKIIKPLLVHSGALTMQSKLSAPTALILCYHSVSDRRLEQSAVISPGITVDADRFEQQMSILRKEYHPVTLDDLADSLKLGTKLPRREVAVTFDDGFADNYHLAAPIMEKYDIRGAIYLAVDAVRRQELPWYCRLHYLFHQAVEKELVFTDPESGRNWHCAHPDEKNDAERFYAKSCVVLDGEEQRKRIEQIESYFGYKLDLSQPSPGMMTFAQAKELRRRGHIIGSHTLSHGTAGLLTAEQLQREIGGAHQILEQELGEPVQHFSYPHPYQIDPQWNDDSLKQTEQLGYKTAVLTRHGLVYQAENPLLLPRLYIGNDHAERFRWHLESAFAGLGMS